MLTTFISWLRPPVFPEDEDKTRSALLLNVVLNTFLVALPAIIIGAILGGNVPRLDRIITIITIAWLAIFGTRLIMLTGRVVMAGIVTVVIIFIATTLAVYNIGTIRAPATSFYLLITVMTGLIINRRAILWMAAVCSVTIITFMLAEKNGLLPPPALTISVAQGITFTVVFTIIGILLYLAVKSIDEALARARQELSERQRAEKRFRGLLESAPDAMVVVNSSGTILLANSQLQKMFGYAREEVLGHPVEMLLPQRFTNVHPLHRKHFEKNPRARLMGVDISLYALRKDGNEFPVEIGLSPMESDEDDLIIATIRDVTERIHAERERERYIEELGKQNAELERFTYTVSHELKNPIITIKGYLGSIKKDMQNKNYARAINDLLRVSTASDKLHQTISDLLDLSRIGRIINSPEEIDLNQLVQEALGTIHGEINSRNIRVVLSPDLPVVYADRIRLREVYENLIANAAKYMGGQHSPLIEIGRREQGAEMILFVKDNGIGIDPKYHTRVFGLFDKLDATSDGTGIGLALVKRIVEVHGGRIWVESEGLEKGSTFYFTIPDKRRNP